jgi:hypothetical protein
VRAAFVIDDPNLRRPRYGHLDYARLLADARARGYHVAIATVPLDGRLAHPRAVELFRAGAGHLSLCVHGNDHDGAELGRPRSYGQARALVAQALARVGAFERRTGLAVERVMAPPHERICEPVAHALRAFGFEAITTTRPYPWLASRPGDPWLAHPPAAGALAGWRPVELLAGGLPNLPRADFSQPVEELELRAFLGQPLILYGHHDLLAGGPARLAEAAARIERLAEGGVRWGSLAAIARAHAPGASREERAAAHDEPVSRQAEPASPRSAPIWEPDLRRVSRRRLRPLLRRLASEGRDRLGARVAAAQASARSSSSS